MAFSVAVLCLCLASFATSQTLAPQVQLDYGTFVGTRQYAGVDSYLGIPFATAGRLENSILYNSSSQLGTVNATQYGPACPQQQLTATQFQPGSAEINGILAALEQIGLGPVENQSEDCLSINVQVPSGLESTADLPVMMWIFGGGFELGSSAALGSEGTTTQGVIYQGANIVSRSVAMGQPIVFVSANYRLNAFGTLSSQEIKDAGVSNLALKDQRTAMQWVNKYVSAFGGDESKVTLFGESAGSISIAMQMVLNGGDTEGLFRGAIMASGGMLKLKDYHRGQPTFDFIADKSGCGTASDKIACLRAAPYDQIYDAVQQVPNFFSYVGLGTPWTPRPDGEYFQASPHTLLREGKVAKIPYIIGDMVDEGTIFSLNPQKNITTNADFTKFWKDNFFPTLSDKQIKAFTRLYSQNPAAGSPFGTGDANAIGPQYKRLAAAQGDFLFQDTRRDLLNYTYNKQPAYTYLIAQSLPILGQLSPLSNLTGLPLIGSFHASDVILNDFGNVPAAVSQNTLNLMSTYIAFVNSLNPNNHGLSDLPKWPTWDPSKKAMFHFQESGVHVIRDNYREKAMAFVNENADTYIF